MARSSRREPREARPSSKGMRSCIACRGRFPRADLIRVVCDPQGQVLVDRFLKAPGRGAHLCYAAECLENAVRRRAFGRAFKRAVTPVEAEALVNEVREAIDGRLFDALALARRAGHTRAGLDVLEREMRNVSLLVLASDVAEGSRNRLERSARANGCAVWAFPGDRASLGRLLGKPHRVAVGITDETTAETVRNELERRARILVAA